MSNLQLLEDALEYIEEHLLENVKTEEIAAHCYCSKSTLEKLFRNVNNISVHDYIVRRKMVLAARMLRSGEKSNLLELALQLGYQSNEAFSRAFRKVWQCNPSQYARRYPFAELYPRLLGAPVKGETAMSKNVDISELYDLFTQRRSCWFVCVDIRHMTSINQISRKAGDLAILETMNRLAESAGEEDVPFRIGGDEFVLLTNSSDQAYACSIVEKMQAKNGASFNFEGQFVPVALHFSVMQCQSPSSVRYQELFQALHSNIEENKRP